MFCGEKSVLTPYIGGEQVNYSNVGEYVKQTQTGYSFCPPEWVGDLIIVEANIANVTAEGTFAAATEVLEHMADMGVNGLWLTPIFDNTGNMNAVSHYGNRGPHTFGADCFRAVEHEKRQEELRSFVREAHKRNIYVFMDVVTYGALATSPMFEAYKSGTEFEGMDVSGWFTGKPAFSGYRYDWSSKTLRYWFAERMLDLIREYDIDGFRVDSEPSYLWYTDNGKEIYADIFTEVRLRAAGYRKLSDGTFDYPPTATGRKIVVFSEKNNLRENSYDFEQMGVIHYGDELTIGFQLVPDTRKNWFLEEDIVSSVKSGSFADGRWFEERLRVGKDFRNCFQYYTYCISNHDTHTTVINRSIIIPAYQAMFAPFLPIWYYGEECGFISYEDRWLNSERIDIGALLGDERNVEFYRNFKKTVAIRRGYPDLFRVFPSDIRTTNIASVSVSAPALAYARYSDKRMALIVANPSAEKISTSLSFTWLCSAAPMTRTEDLMSSCEYIAHARGADVSIDDIILEAEGIAVILLEAQS